MKYTNLGKTGLEVSRLCLGGFSFGNRLEWQIEIDQAKPIVEKALDLGINFFDTANIYSGGRSEEILGELLKEYRDDVIIATKCRYQLEGIYIDNPVPNKGGLSRFHIFRAIEASLKRLQMDYIDLYQIHSFWSLDRRPLPALEELLGTFNHLIDQGKILHFGANNMRAWLFVKSFWMAERYGYEPFSTMQNHYNLVYREEEREMLPFCEDQQVGVLPWSPLARGFLSGKYKRSEGPQSSDSIRGKTDQMMTRRYFRPEDFDIVDRVVEVAEEKDVTPAQIALAWLLNKPVITSPIVGFSKVEYVESAIEALEIKLSSDDIKHMEEPYIPHSTMGN